MGSKMSVESAVDAVVRIISILIGILLLLLLPVYLLPTSFSGIPLEQCPRPPSLSVIVATSVLMAHNAGVSLMGSAQFTSGSLFCGIDTVL
ncbi:hypothetical protein BD324DRAFT_326286 [Kockovaella imperatae]|uniref:Uncharacterized protein n=1 Tax=Kockovaella imperatae TaxID=4999 RepID=A0A1Y1UMX0_9TREE|nr:hypothetical protein BD324DRAFT_326286 [Kockovaella imperatae]ORX39342.1 hypothetical protein BD324DRAFT_326286 [Kockovaella imperatae]